MISTERRTGIERPTGRRRLARLLLLGSALLAIGCRLDAPRDPDAPEAWVEEWAGMARLGPGFAVWESNRTGAWRIWLRELDGSGLRQLSPDESGRDHFAPHVSPDGSRVVYLSYPRPRNSYQEVREEIEVPLRVLHLDSGEQRVIAPNARSSGESRAVVWIDNDRLVHLDGAGYARELDLRTGASVPITPPDEEHKGYLVNAVKTHASREDPTFCLYRSPQAPIVRRPRRAGCQAYFSRDGRFGFWTSRTGGPIQKIDLASGRMGVILGRDDPRMPAGRGYVYFPMLSPDQRLLAFGASTGQHDHFHADYEIFVAPIDPRTLELTGKPVRYTFDPGTDRFPDVFVAGLEFGHHRGEAPFPLRLDPSRIRGGPEGEGPWRWRFGDGSETVGAVGEHVFRTAGRYRVTATRGDVQLRAEVDVDEASPPGPIRAVLHAGDREIAVFFDELIAADALSLRLESNAAILRSRLGPEGRSLVIELAEPLAGDDQLWIAGVTDRAAVPNPMPEQRIAVIRSAWPSRWDGLVYLFRTANDDNLVPDPRSRERRSYSRRARGRARYDHDGAMQLSGGYVEIEEAAERLVHACRASGEFAFEGLLRAHDLEPEGRRRIATITRGSGESLFTLDQVDSSLRLRIWTSSFAADERPRIFLGRLPREGPVHLVVTYRDGHLVSYLNGQKLTDADEVRGDLSNWTDPDTVAFGSKPGGGADWQGSLEGIALYCRFIGAEEAGNNAHNYFDILREREVVPRVRVRARLLAASRIPTLEQITPYREALVLHEWEVLDVLAGELGDERVRVAHWAILDEGIQSIAQLEPGAQSELVVEPFAENEQVASFYLSDTLELDLGVPVFLDVSP